jgi:hypothetical protein
MQFYSFCFIFFFFLISYPPIKSIIFFACVQSLEWPIILYHLMIVADINVVSFESFRNNKNLNYYMSEWNKCISDVWFWQFIFPLFQKMQQSLWQLFLIKNSWYDGIKEPKQCFFSTANEGKAFLAQYKLCYITLSLFSWFQKSSFK